MHTCKRNATEVTKICLKQPKIFLQCAGNSAHYRVQVSTVVRKFLEIVAMVTNGELNYTSPFYHYLTQSGSMTILSCGTAADSD